jgi:hypothetical protein
MERPAVVAIEFVDDCRLVLQTCNIGICIAKVFNEAGIVGVPVPGGAGGGAKTEWVERARGVRTRSDPAVVSCLPDGKDAVNVAVMSSVTQFEV